MRPSNVTPTLEPLEDRTTPTAYSYFLASNYVGSGFGSDRTVAEATEHLLGRLPSGAELEKYHQWAAEKIWTDVAIRPEYTDPSPTVGDYVRRLYRDVLHREADASEVAPWLTQIQRHGLSAAAAGIVYSPEAAWAHAAYDYAEWLGRPMAPSEAHWWTGIAWKEADSRILGSDEAWQGHQPERAYLQFLNDVLFAEYAREPGVLFHYACGRGTSGTRQAPAG
jgi:hypothetical protein